MEACTHQLARKIQSIEIDPCPMESGMTDHANIALIKYLREKKTEGEGDLKNPRIAIMMFVLSMFAAEKIIYDWIDSVPIIT